MAKRRKCPRCKSENLRLEIPPDFEDFEVCRDCGYILRTCPMCYSKRVAPAQDRPKDPIVDHCRDCGYVLED